MEETEKRIYLKKYYYLSKKIYKTTKTCFGIYHPETRGAIRNLLIIYLDFKNRYQRAEILARTAINITRETKGIDSRDYCSDLFFLGLAYEGQGKYTQTINTFTKHLNLEEKHKGFVYDFLTYRPYIKIITALIKKNDFLQAEKVYHQFESKVIRAYTKKSHQYAHLLEHSYVIFDQQQKIEQTENMLNTCLSIRLVLEDTSKEFIIRAMDNLAGFYTNQNQLDKAHQLYQQKNNIMKNESIDINDKKAIYRNVTKIQQKINQSKPPKKL